MQRGISICRKLCNIQEILRAKTRALDDVLLLSALDDVLLLSALDDVLLLSAFDDVLLLSVLDDVLLKFLNIFNYTDS